MKNIGGDMRSEKIFRSKKAKPLIYYFPFGKTAQTFLKDISKKSRKMRSSVIIHQGLNEEERKNVGFAIAHGTGGKYQ